MKRRLVFYWFMPNKKYEGKFANTNKRNLDDVEKYEKLHLNCLKHYSKIFDCATFIIAHEEGVTDEEIGELEKKIVECGYINSRFMVTVNDPVYGECPMWKKIVLENEENFDGLTFYYHTKGITHPFSNSLTDWTTALYYFNLDYFKMVCDVISSDEQKFAVSGFFLVYHPQDDSNHNYDADYHYYYSGNSYWLNHKKIKAYMDSVGKKLEDYKLENRWSAESAFSYLLPNEFSHSIAGTITEKELDFYKNSMSYIMSIVNPLALKGYLDFKYNTALKGITL